MTSPAEWRAANRDHVRAYNLAYRREHATEARMRNRLKNWRDAGIVNPDGTPFGHADYDARLAEQGGTCALCPREDADARGSALHADHDHATGVVRGLLCRRCNQNIIGRLEAALRDERLMAYLNLEVRSTA